LDSIAPFKDSEDWDNTGLLVGDMQSEVTGVLTTIDCSMETVDEARHNDINVVVDHHPVISAKTSSVTEGGTGAIIRSQFQNHSQYSGRRPRTAEVGSCESGRRPAGGLYGLFLRISCQRPVQTGRGCKSAYRGKRGTRERR